MRKDGYSNIDQLNNIVGDVLNACQGEVQSLGVVERTYANDLLVMIEQARYLKKKLVIAMKRGDDKTMNLTRFFKPLCECIQMCYNELRVLCAGMESENLQDVRRGVGEAIKILKREMAQGEADS